MLLVAPVALRGHHVLLEPLALSHATGIRAAVADGQLWNLCYTTVPAPENMAAKINMRLARQAAGTMLLFVVRQTGADNKMVGITAYCNVDSVNRLVEIGSTWVAQLVQRTALNTEAKLLLLSHTFESLGCIAVEFQSHWMNQQSRAAIECLGAKLDGVLRSHSVSAAGVLRDTSVYSIIAAEWPTVRSHLRFCLSKYG